jgi:hypothetical protein
MLLLLLKVLLLLLFLCHRFFLPSSIQTASFLTPEQRLALLRSFKQAAPVSPSPSPTAFAAEDGAGVAAATDSAAGRAAISPGLSASPDFSSKRVSASLVAAHVKDLDAVHHLGTENVHTHEDPQQAQQQQQWDGGYSIRRQQQGVQEQQYQQLQHKQRELSCSREPTRWSGSPPEISDLHSGAGNVDSDVQLLLEGDHHQSSSSTVGTSGSPGDSTGVRPGVPWHQVWKMWCHPVVRYAGAWRVLHDIPGYGILYWTPIMVQAVLTTMHTGHRGLLWCRWLQQAVLCPSTTAAAAGTVDRGAAGAAAALAKLRGTGSEVLSHWVSELHLSKPWSLMKMAALSEEVPGGAAMGSAAVRSAAPIEEHATVAGLTSSSTNNPLEVLSRVLLPGRVDAAARASQQPQQQQQQGPLREQGAVAVVLLSAIPYACASLFHVANAWHSQRTQEWRWHIAGVWCVGAIALLLMPVLWHWHTALAFAALTVAHVGVNGANGLQTGLVARCFSGDDKALGLAMYNTIASLGGLLGPFLIGLMVDVLGGYTVAMVVLSLCLAAAAAMVWCFRPSTTEGATD